MDIILPFCDHNTLEFIGHFLCTGELRGNSEIREQGIKILNDVLDFPSIKCQMPSVECPMEGCEENVDCSNLLSHYASDIRQLEANDIKVPCRICKECIWC